MSSTTDLVTITIFVLATCAALSAAILSRSLAQSVAQIAPGRKVNTSCWKRAVLFIVLANALMIAHVFPNVLVIAALISGILCPIANGSKLPQKLQGTACLLAFVVAVAFLLLWLYELRLESWKLVSSGAPIRMDLILFVVPIYYVFRRFSTIFQVLMSTSVSKP